MGIPPPVPEDSAISTVLAWMNTFPSDQPPLTTIQDLKDGRALHQILLQVDPTFFALTSARTLVVPLSSLFQLVSKYYQEALTSPISPAVSAAVVAFPEATGTLFLIAQLVLGIAVQAEQNQPFIAVIQSLDAETQNGLMRLIEDVWKNKTCRNRPGVIPECRATGDSADADQEPLTPGTACSKESIPLKSAHDRLLRDYERLKGLYEHAVSERDAAWSKLGSPKSSSSSMAGSRISIDSDPEATIRVLKTQLETLRASLTSSEDERIRLHGLVASNTTIIDQLQGRIESLQAKAALADDLGARVDHLTAERERATKLAHLVDTYKAKLSLGSGLKSQTAQLEQENMQLLERISQLETSVTLLSAAQDRAQQYKHEILVLDQSRRELMEEKQMMEAENETLRETIEVLGRDKETMSKEVEIVSERLKDLELDVVLKEGEGRVLQSELGGFEKYPSQNSCRPASSCAPRGSLSPSKSSSSYTSQLEAQNQSLYRAVQKARHFIAQQAAEISALSSIPSNLHALTAPAQEEAREDSEEHLKRMLFAKSREYEQLKVRYTNLVKRLRSEQRLITAAWYELGTRVHGADSKPGETTGAGIPWLAGTRSRLLDSMFSATPPV